jgi:hypothetical protein
VTELKIVIEQEGGRWETIPGTAFYVLEAKSHNSAVVGFISPTQKIREGSYKD